MSGPSHRSACTTGAADFPAHCMTLGPACRNRTVRPSILSVLVEPSVKYEAFAGTALVRPSWFAATRPSGTIRTPSRRASASMAASKSTGAARFSTLLILGMSYSPCPARRNWPALTRRDSAWSTASRLPRSRKSLGVHTHLPLPCADTLFTILSAMRVTSSHPSHGPLGCQNSSLNFLPPQGRSKRCRIRRCETDTGSWATTRPQRGLSAPPPSASGRTSPLIRFLVPTRVPDVRVPMIGGASVDAPDHVARRAPRLL